MKAMPLRLADNLARSLDSLDYSLAGPFVVPAVPAVVGNLLGRRKDRTFGSIAILALRERTVRPLAAFFDDGFRPRSFGVGGLLSNVV